MQGRFSRLFSLAPIFHRQYRGSPKHVELQQQLGKQLEKYRNINKNINSLQFTRLILLSYAEDGSQEAQSFSPQKQMARRDSFEGRLIEQKEQIQDHLREILAEMNEECSDTEIQAAPPSPSPAKR